MKGKNTLIAQNWSMLISHMHMHMALNLKGMQIEYKTSMSMYSYNYGTKHEKGMVYVYKH